MESNTHKASQQLMPGFEPSEKDLIDRALAHVEWARSHIQNDQAQAAPLAASSLERLVGQED